MDSKGYPYPQPPPQYGAQAQFGTPAQYDQYGQPQPQPIIVEQQQGIEYLCVFF